jgi:hypothetical protein
MNNKKPFLITFTFLFQNEEGRRLLSIVNPSQRGNIKVHTKNKKKGEKDVWGSEINRPPIMEPTTNHRTDKLHTDMTKIYDGAAQLRRTKRMESLGRH